MFTISDSISFWDNSGILYIIDFYHYDLSDDQVKQILIDSGLKEKNL